MAITVNYYWPVTTPGSTTPAAANQKPPTIPVPPSTVAYNEVVAQLTSDAASTSIVVTHNLGITAGELAELWPEIRFEPIVAGGPSLYIIARAANTVTVGLAATTPAGAFSVVRIRRSIAPSR